MAENSIGDKILPIIKITILRKIKSRVEIYQKKICLIKIDKWSIWNIVHLEIAYTKCKMHCLQDTC